jgi:ankyrin repeat protein
MELTESYEFAWNSIPTTKLGLACFFERNDVVLDAIKEGIDWSEETVHPLHAALYSDSPALIEPLLVAGSPVDGQALYLAYRFGGTKTFLLVSDSKYPSTLDTKNMNLILLDAARGGDMLPVEYVLGHGAEVNAIDYWYGFEGWTALHHAARLLNKPLMEYLVEHGADVNLRNAENSTPLKLCAQKHTDATKRQRKECVEFLTSHGAEYGEPISFISKMMFRNGSWLYISPTAKM